jgi:hypothetical protein
MPAAGAGAFFTGRPVKNVPAQDAGSFSRKMPWIRPQPTSYATPEGRRRGSKQNRPGTLSVLLNVDYKSTLRKVIISF